MYFINICKNWKEQSIKWNKYKIIILRCTEYISFHSFFILGGELTGWWVYVMLGVEAVWIEMGMGMKMG